MKYNIIKNSIKVPYEDRTDIKAGVTLTQESIDMKIVDSFESLEVAKAELKNFVTLIRELSNGLTYYLVEEFYIQDEEFEVYGFSKMEIELVEKTSYDTINIFDNMADAEKAYNNYDGENEVYISF